MKAFATVDSLQEGWRTLTSEEEAVAPTLLKRATAYLVALLQRNNIDVDYGDVVQQINLETVTCNMVRRLIDAPTGGASSISQGIGATNASVSFSNPDASLYLSKSDMLALGLVGKSKYRSIEAHTWADDACICESGTWATIATLGSV